MSYKENKVYRWLDRIWSSTTERTWLKWFARFLWVGAIAAVIGGALILWSVSRGDLPGFQELENPQYDLASVIYDAQGISYGKYYIENREFVDFKDLSPNAINALLSVEDARYYNHSGIDLRALIRVAIKSVLLQKGNSGGGSTISQQLAKLLFQRKSLRGKSSIDRAMTLASIKFKEWITAVRLEKRYTKGEIMAMYLNKFEFINGAHGIQSAAQIYFGKDQKDIDIQEAAVLVGMLKNPAYFNPIRFPERTQNRRDVVLNQMVRNDKIYDVLRDSLVNQSIDMSAFHRGNQSEGIAPYFRAELTKWLKSLLLKPDYHKPEGGTYDIYRDGLKIYTTIDARYQTLAEEAVFEHLKSLQKRYWNRWRGMDPITFEAEKHQVDLRLASVNRRVRDSDFYRGGYQKYFKDLSAKSEKEYQLQLKEPTIRKLIKDASYVNSIEGSKQGQFKKLIASGLWNEIKTSWAAFAAELEKTLKEEIDATVFDYSKSRKKVERMSREDSIIYHLRHLQAGLLSVDPKTGEIKAWVGGPDHTTFKYDHVTMRRQVGSTIKPFVYVTAIGVQGISPCQEYSDIQYTIAPGDADLHVDAEWSPSNANGTFTQNLYNLYQGLLYSKNSITIRLVKELGTMAPIRDLLHNVGIDKYERINDGRLVVPEVPSLSLGSVDLSVLEMTGAYTTFANDGIYTEPTFINRIEDKNGKIIYQSSPIQRRAINQLYNSVIVDMLRNNVGGGFKVGIKTPAGGKTGTTNDYADGWFMGITPNLVTGVWVGGDEKWVRFYTLDDGQGFVMARPVFQNFMQKIEASEEIDFNTKASFAPPPPGFRDLVDCTRYKQRDPEEERGTRLDEKIDLDEFDEIELEEELDLPEIDTSGFH
ncbi:MAG: penicillin-binding protein 1A [Saprospiraceae bacterium]|jgi:penicillin-binding protein 1A